MKKNKNYLKIGIRLFLFTLPLLFIGPVVLTIGFKAINRDKNYIFFIIGAIICISVIILLSVAVKRILQYLFDQ